MLTLFLRHFPEKFSETLPHYQPPSPTDSNTKLYNIDSSKIPEDNATFENLKLKDKFEKQTLKGTLQNSFSTNVNQNKSEENDDILEDISTFGMYFVYDFVLFLLYLFVFYIIDLKDCWLTIAHWCTQKVLFLIKVFIKHVYINFFA